MSSIDNAGWLVPGHFSSYHGMARISMALNMPVYIHMEIGSIRIWPTALLNVET